VEATIQQIQAAGNKLETKVLDMQDRRIVDMSEQDEKSEAAVALLRE
jgi:hypothetical protein